MGKRKEKGFTKLQTHGVTKQRHQVNRKIFSDYLYEKNIRESSQIEFKGKLLKAFDETGHTVSSKNNCREHLNHISKPLPSTF